MKITKKKVSGESRWIVKIDGAAVGEVSVQNTAGGLFLPYRPCLYTDKVCEDGDKVLRMLGMQSTLDGAVEALALACRKPTEAVAVVSDRVTFIGVGMTQKKADQFAAGIRRRGKK